MGSTMKTGATKVTIGAVKEGLREIKANGVVVGMIETTRDGYVVAMKGETGIVPLFVAYATAVWHARCAARRAA